MKARAEQSVAGFDFEDANRRGRADDLDETRLKQC